MMTHTPVRHTRTRAWLRNLLLLLAVLPITAAQAPPNHAAAASQQGGELLIAPYTSGPSAATSAHEYSGSLTLTVSGIGQASGTAYTDAFYQLTDGAGNPIPPYYPGGWTLSINQQLAVDFIPDHQIPDYRSDHSYNFTINAPGGRLAFGVHDLYTADNSGSYIIQISGASPDEVPYFSQRDERWKDHLLDGTCSDWCVDPGLRFVTIGRCGCTLTCATMLFDHYGANLLPPDLSDCMGIKACPFYWFVGASCSQGRATWAVHYRQPFNWIWLDQQLNQHGRPVLLEMHRGDNRNDTHWVLVTSGHGDSPGQYIAHDPWPLNGANTTLATLARQNYNFDTLLVYDKQPTSNRSSVSPATPAGLFTPAIQPTAQPERSPVRAPASDPAIVHSPTITSTATVYHVNETAVVVQLAAVSNAGDVTLMKVWTDSNPVSEWQPFETLTWLPWQPEDHVYALFRDEAGNTSDQCSDSISPPAGPAPRIFSLLYLPMLSRAP